MLYHRVQCHPGEFLYRVYLMPNGISISKAAKAIGISVSSLSRLINGEFSLTGDMALKLSALCGSSPEMWMNMQANYSISKAYAESGPPEITNNDLANTVRETVIKVKSGNCGFVTNEEADMIIKNYIASIENKDL